jgi:hypothetical protein
MLNINASIVQGSGIGPVAFVCNASDLHPITPGNSFNKYADDTYFIAPSINSSSIASELEQVSVWATRNNLKLNSTKSVEMIVHKPHVKLQNLSVPPPNPDVARVITMKILGVTFSDTLSFEPHVEKIASNCAQLCYALRVLKNHGLFGPRLWDVTRATLVAKMTYASPAWWGFMDAAGKNRFQAILTKLEKQGFLNKEDHDFVSLCNASDDTLFFEILHNRNHVLHQLLPPVKQTGHDLRERSHNRVIPRVDDTILKKNFIIRMLYKDSY